MKYHLFVSYSHRDAAEVLEIVRKLQRHSLKVWIDADGDLLGKRLNEELEERMRESLSVGVFIGGTGMGNYHRDELNAALTLSHRGIDVFPVFLPSSPTDLDAPSFLAGRGGVDLRREPEVELERLARKLVQRWERAMPPPPPDPPDEEDDDEQDDGRFALENAVDEIVAGFHERPPTFFLGSRFPRGEGLPPTACRVAHDLLTELGIVDGDKEHEDILPSLETASRYYAAARSAQRLELNLRQAHGKTTRPPDHYALLVRVLKRVLDEMQSRVGAPMTADDVPLQLVVTTNTDLWLERELVASRVPYTRVVMNRSGTRLQVNAVEGYMATDDAVTLVTGAAQTRVHFESGGTALRRDELDRAIARHGVRYFGRSAEPLIDLPAFLGDADRETPLVIYKHHGSQDCLDSCAVSTDHYFELASATAAVPSTVTSRISNMPSLLLGYSPLDADFRQLYHTLLHRLFDEGPRGLYRILLQCAPRPGTDDTCRCRAESRIWKGVKRQTQLEMKIDVLEVGAEPFLSGLLERLYTGVV
jgi:hypothetical protein